MATPTDQITEEAWTVREDTYTAILLFNDEEIHRVSRNYKQDLERIAHRGNHEIKAAVEKALKEAFTEHVWKFSDDWTEGRISALERQLRVAQASEK